MVGCRDQTNSFNQLAGNKPSSASLSDGHFALGHGPQHGFENVIPSCYDIEFAKERVRVHDGNDCREEDRGRGGDRCARSTAPCRDSPFAAAPRSMPRSRGGLRVRRNRIRIWLRGGMLSLLGVTCSGRLWLRAAGPRAGPAPRRVAFPRLDKLPAPRVVARDGRAAVHERCASSRAFADAGDRGGSARRGRQRRPTRRLNRESRRRAHRTRPTPRATPPDPESLRQIFALRGFRSCPDAGGVFGQRQAGRSEKQRGG